MKKLSVLLAIFLLCLSIITCGNEDEETDEDRILDRIEDLEDAINSDNYTAFMKCMHGGSSQFYSYSETSFEGKFLGVTYSFHDITIYVNGSLANVQCTATVDETTDWSTTFEMKTEGDKWYVNEWYENSSLVYDTHTAIP